MILSLSILGSYIIDNGWCVEGECEKGKMSGLSEICRLYYRTVIEGREGPTRDWGYGVDIVGVAGGNLPNITRCYRRALHNYGE